MGSYTKAEYILPQEVLELVQNYVDGACIYIPRRDENRRAWGETNDAKQMTVERNRGIYQNYLEGMAVEDLAGKYFLSVKSIQRIVLEEKRKEC